MCMCTPTHNTENLLVRNRHSGNDTKIISIIIFFSIRSCLLNLALNTVPQRLVLILKSSCST